MGTMGLDMETALAILNLALHANAEILRLPCVTFANFDFVRKGKAMRVPFLTLEGIDADICKYECIKDRRCLSINVNEDQSICQLNSRSGQSALAFFWLSTLPGWTFLSTSNKRLLGRNCMKQSLFSETLNCVDTCSCPGFEYKAYCPVRFKRLNCFNGVSNPPRGKALPLLVSTERDVRHTLWNGHVLDWGGYYEQLRDIVCRCVTKVSRLGHKYAGLMEYGECWTAEDQTTIPWRFGASNHCVDGRYTACSPDAMFCTGQEFAVFVYEIL
ncbi:uncharacterized protein LOC135687053 [Rhopilema esculentum]|uniref:uncharacterized protein LOC135687053 n=1 Tax=Rhopilema esculentum TaxID=499914 RepID=UPI0031D041DB